MLLGRVMSGKGGDLILSTCRQVLQEESPALYEKVEVMLPGENTRRVGQSAAAAIIPESGSLSAEKKFNFRETVA